MPERNRTHQRIIVRPISDRTFMPNKGIGCFLLSMKEKNLIDVLSAHNIEYNITIEESVTSYMFDIESDTFYVFFYYNKRGLDYISIHTTRIMLQESIEKNKTTIQEAITIVENYYQKHNIIPFNYSYTKDTLEVFIEFKFIGLSLWFENNCVSDISVG